MPLQTNLLRESFELVLPKSEALMKTFYDTLFKRHPQVKPLFAGTDMAAQRHKLFQAIQYVIGNLENPEGLESTLKNLGRAHVGYGAELDHYPAVGEALIEALRRTAGDAWTPDLEDAWIEAYAAVSGIMQEGARESAS